MARKKRDGVKPVKVKHLVNCLYQIEIWAAAVRKALEALDQAEVVELNTKTEVNNWAKGLPPKRTAGCPAPR